MNTLTSTHKGTCSLNLDMSSGNRLMWDNKNPPFTIFIDKRGPELSIPPDIICSWTHLPFRAVFHTIFWDPPHLIHKDTGISLFKKYGQFNTKRALIYSISKGASESSKIGKILALKWSETNFKIWNLLPLLKPWILKNKIKPHSRMGSCSFRTSYKNTYWLILKNINT